jgi:hypothetical protein
MDIDFNTECYTFKKITYQKGIYDESVDATYIIHLKDNGRIDHIYEQLTMYHPTKVVYIVYNLGFKKDSWHHEFQSGDVDQSNDRYYRNNQ